MTLRFVLLFLAVSATFAQTEGLLLQNPHARRTLPLDGQWDIIVDPFETGYYNHRYQPSSEGFFQDRKMEKPWDLIEYDFDSGPTLNVPGDWNTQDEQLFLYEGTIWYKRSFSYAPAAGQRAFLYFGAVNYEAHVYLNGQSAGHHVGGFTPFNLEVTSGLKEGQNTLIVKADNKRRRDGVPTVNFDWWNYGGLTRSVMLVTVPETFIADYFVQLAPGRRDQIQGWIQLDGPQAANQPVRIEIPEASLSETVRTDADGFATLEMPAHLQLWSPDRPKLYQVSIQSRQDRISDSIGFRTIERTGEDILLNGKPIFLRGISIHEEKAFGGGRAAAP